MRLTTIWTIPAMSMRERLRRTADWAAFEAAAHLPQRVRYWAFIQVGGKAVGDRVVTEVSFTDVLNQADGGPR